MKKNQSGGNSGKYIFRHEDFPTDPGCYLMKNSKGQVIYVGKAGNLRRRLAYYFRSRRQYYKTKRMVPRIHDVEVILVNNETESLILENNLIKHHKPRYNSMLMQDDVGYPFIVLTGEKYPRLLPYRKNWSNRQWSETEGQEEGKRFGPYLSKNFRDAVMNFAIETFGLRICRNLPQKVCFRYRLKKCSGLCEGLVSPEEYGESVRLAAELLEYRYTGLLARLKKQMETCSENLDYESAAKLRDRINIIENILEKQIVERDEKYDQDVLFFGDFHVMAMEIKKGMLLNANLFKLPFNENNNIFKDFISSRCQTRNVGEIISNMPENIEITERPLFSKNNTPVKMTIPEQGRKMDLLMLCKKNYDYQIRKMSVKNGRHVKGQGGSNNRFK